MRIGAFQILNWIFLIFVAIVFFYFLIVVSNSDLTIAKKISAETYTDEEGNLNKGEWMWAIGEFVAVMSGWSYFLSTAYDFTRNSDKKVEEPTRETN